jgi:hypothetical protein
MLLIEDALFTKYCNNQRKESEMGMCIVSRRVYKVLVKVKSKAIPVTDPEARVRFPALPDFLKKTKKKQNSSGSGTGSTQPREYN